MFYIGDLNEINNEDLLKKYDEIISMFKYTSIDVGYEICSDHFLDTMQYHSPIHYNEHNDQNLTSCNEEENKISSIHGKSTISQIFSNNELVFIASAKCDLSIRENPISIHPKDNSFHLDLNKLYSASSWDEMSFKIIDLKSNEDIDDFEGECQVDVGKNILDYLYRNLTKIEPSAHDLKAIENDFRIKLMKSYDVSPSQLFDRLKSEITAKSKFLL